LIKQIFQNKAEMLLNFNMKKRFKFFKINHSKFTKFERDLFTKKLYIYIYITFFSIEIKFISYSEKLVTKFTKFK